MINRLPRRALRPILFAIAISMLLLSTPTTASIPSPACVEFCRLQALECNFQTGGARQCGSVYRKCLARCDLP